MEHKKDAIIQRWEKDWNLALSLWSDYTMLRQPIWCRSQKEAARQGLTGSFAMIRLTDHLVVINIEDVMAYNLVDDGLPILAHEIGHHVMAPANLYDHGKLIARMQMTLAGIEDRTPLVANLYTDQLINQHLFVNCSLDMAGIYRKINTINTTSRVWQWMMRSFEILWKLDKGYLASREPISQEMEADAILCASLIRSYSRDWLDGAGRYAALVYPYLVEDHEYKKGKRSLAPLQDTETCGQGGEIVDGLAEISVEDRESMVDPRVEALEAGGHMDNEKPAIYGENLPGGEGPRQRYRNPGTYADLMKRVNPDLRDTEILMRYYREIARPFLVPFPVEKRTPFSENLPEGTEEWEIGDDVETIDWLETVLASQEIIPGITTKKRTYGRDAEENASPDPFNLYIGVDCSGSMINPGFGFSWPVLAGTILGVSAIRAGAKVMAVLSGEPGSWLATKDFLNSEKEILKVLVDYLGTGYAFGIPRLAETFKNKMKKKTHILIVSDDDIYAMLGAKAPDGRPGWDIATEALEYAGGGGTMVLHSQRNWHTKKAERLEKIGWQIHYVTREEELLTFAEQFSKKHYDRTQGS